MPIVVSSRIFPVLADAVDVADSVSLVWHSIEPNFKPLAVFITSKIIGQLSFNCNCHLRTYFAVNSMAMLKPTFKDSSVAPTVPSPTMFHALEIFTLIGISIGRSPVSLSIHIVSFEFTLIESLIFPDIFSLTMKLIFKIISVIGISIRKELETFTLFDSRYEISFVTTHTCA